MSDYFFDQDLRGHTINELKNLYRKMETAIAQENYSEIESLNTLIFLYLKASMEEKSYSIVMPDFDSKAVQLMEDFPVTVQWDGSLLRIKTPLIIGHKNREQIKSKKDTPIVYCVSAAINYWKYKNPDIKPFELMDQFERPLLLGVIHWYKKFNRNLLCDNDNIESSLIQNMLCSTLGISDRCDVLDYIHVARQCTEEKDIGTEFVLSSHQNVFSYLENK